MKNNIKTKIEKYEIIDREKNGHGDWSVAKMVFTASSPQEAAHFYLKFLGLNLNQKNTTFRKFSREEAEDWFKEINLEDDGCDNETRFFLHKESEIVIQINKYEKN